MDRRFVPLFLAFFLMLAPLALAQDQPPSDAEADNATADDAANDTAAANETADGEAEPAAPEVDGATELVLEAHQEGSSFFFVDPDTGARNPALYVKPGAEITLTLIGVSGVHNIQVEGFDPSDYVNPGETITYTFIAPAEGERLPYWCVPHKSAGMGSFVVGGAPPAAGAGGDVEGPEINGPAVDLATLGFPQCAGFMIPQATAEGAVGGPTVEDYVELCEAGDQPVGAYVAQAHPADYVIPATWALIGLGIVGVVWVHRYYKP